MTPFGIISRSAIALVLSTATALGQALPNPELPGDLKIDIPDTPEADGAADDADAPSLAKATGVTGLKIKLVGTADLLSLGGPVAALAGEQPTVEPHGMLQLSLDRPLTDGLDLSLDVAAISGDGEERIVLRRGVLTFRPTNTLTLSAGAEYKAWSFFDIIHPLDPVQVDEERIDPDDITEEFAHPFAELSFVFENSSLQFLATTEAFEFSDIDRDTTAGAVRYEHLFEDMRLSGQVIYSENQGVRVGFGADTDLSGTLLAAEIDLATRRFMPTVTPTAIGGQIDAQHSGLFPRIVVGARQSVFGEWQGELLYYYNHHGYNGGEWDRYVLGLKQSVASIQGGNFAPAGFVTAISDATSDRFLRRHYLGTTLSSKDALFPFELAVGGYLGLQDQSAFGFATAKWPVTSFATVALQMSGGFGSDDTEFGLEPVTAQLRFIAEF